MRIAQKLLSLVSSRDSAKRGERASQTTLTPAKPGGRAHALKAAVINLVGGGHGEAAKAERRAADPGTTIGLARSLAHEHGAGIASASMPPMGASGQLRARHTKEWSANAAKMSQELNAKHAQSLERTAASSSGLYALNEATAHHRGEGLEGADYHAVSALGKQLAVAKVASDLRADAKPESMPTQAYNRLLSGHEAALRIREVLIRGGLSPDQAQARMLKAAEQMKAGEAADWSTVVPVRNAGKTNMPVEADRTEVVVAEPTPELRHADLRQAARVDVAVAERMPSLHQVSTQQAVRVEVAVSERMASLRQVNTQQAVRTDPNDVLAQWQALDDELAQRGASAAVLSDHGATAALDHLDEALASMATDALPARARMEQGQEELERPAGLAD